MLLFELSIAAANKEELIKALDRVNLLVNLDATKAKQPSNASVPGYSYDFTLREE